MPTRSRKVNMSQNLEISSEYPDLKVYCINLKERKEKKKWIKKQMKRKGLKFEFYTADKHKTDPKRGCLESHLNIIKMALATNQKHILILEDDAKIIKPIYSLPKFPNDWTMLYLGGTVRDIIKRYDDNWVQVSTWTTHAYILNLEDENFVKSLLEMENYDKEIDKFYIENIHNNFATYMTSPMRVIQRKGYSDIEGKDVDYDFMEQTLYGFKKPEHIIEDNSYRLKLQEIEPNDLPNITVITPTYNRRNLFYIALNNMTTTSYPKNKITWIILDDSDDEKLKVDDIIPRSNKIKHVKLTDKHYTVAEKRNIGASMSQTSIILHMDDDDYYPANSFIARVKLLLKYPDIGCVGSSKVGVYDIIKNKSSMSSDGPLTLAEASMGYTKEFWLRQKFDNNATTGEYVSFIRGRFDKIMDMPFTFNIFAITHSSNLTDNLRKINNTDTVAQNKINFIDDWDIDIQIFFYQLRENAFF